MFARWVPARLGLCFVLLVIGLAVDLATKKLLGPVAYDGYVVPPFIPRPLGIGLAALLALRVASPVLCVASAALLAGIAGNAIAPTGSLDAGSFGAWNVADCLIVAGLMTMLGWLTVWFAIASKRRVQRSAV
jgi:hypothetical protein